MCEGDCRELSMRLYECLEHGGECMEVSVCMDMSDCMLDECEYLNVSVWRWV